MQLKMFKLYKANDDRKLLKIAPKGKVKKL